MLGWGDNFRRTRISFSRFTSFRLAYFSFMNLIAWTVPVSTCFALYTSEKVPSPFRSRFTYLLLLVVVEDDMMDGCAGGWWLVGLNTPILVVVVVVGGGGGVDGWTN